MTFELVAFDCDGVLVETEPAVNRAFVRLVARTGPTLDVQASLQRFRGVSLESRVAAIRDEYGFEPVDTFATELEALLIEAFHAEMTEIPGAAAAVRGLTSPRCVVSNGGRAEMTLKLRKIGLLDAFYPHLFTATELARSKPHPDVYLHAVACMGCTPAVSAAVEDSVPGVQAAVAAGLTVFGYAPDGAGEPLARLGARVFHHMAELPSLLAAG